jgi:hypothetical protein
VQLVPPEYVERLLIVGKNGVGKSELTYALEGNGNYRKTIYCDIKGDCTPRPGFQLVRKGDDSWGLRARRIVYRPTPGTYWRSDAGWAQFLNRWFLHAHRSYDHKRKRSREPALIIIPEVLLFGPKSQQVIGEIASGARALELGLWCETQRPRRIPVVLRSEAWRIYVFPLGYEDDELEILKYAKGKLSLDDLRSLDEQVSPSDPHPFYEIVLRSPQGAQISVRRCKSLALA